MNVYTSAPALSLGRRLNPEPERRGFQHIPKGQIDESSLIAIIALNYCHANKKLDNVGKNAS